MPLIGSLLKKGATRGAEEGLAKTTIHTTEEAAMKAGQKGASKAEQEAAMKAARKKVIDEAAKKAAEKNVKDKLMKIATKTLSEEEVKLVNEMLIKDAKKALGEGSVAEARNVISREVENDAAKAIKEGIAKGTMNSIKGKNILKVMAAGGGIFAIACAYVANKDPISADECYDNCIAGSGLVKTEDQGYFGGFFGGSEPKSLSKCEVGEYGCDAKIDTKPPLMSSDTSKIGDKYSAQNCCCKNDRNVQLFGDDCEKLCSKSNGQCSETNRRRRAMLAAAKHPFDTMSEALGDGVGGLANTGLHAFDFFTWIAKYAPTIIGGIILLGVIFFIYTAYSGVREVGGAAKDAIISEAKDKVTRKIRKNLPKNGGNPRYGRRRKIY